MTRLARPGSLTLLALVGLTLAGGAACRKRATEAHQAPNTAGNVAFMRRPGEERTSFPLRIAADRRHLTDAKGAPFLIHGEAAWSLVAGLDRDGATTYLDDRRRRGFDLVMVNLLEHQFVADPPRNAAGDAPFSTPGDFSTPNEVYFAHAEWVLRQARQRDMAVLLCPAYFGFDGKGEGWFQELIRQGPEKLRAYGEYLGRRFRAEANVIWLLGGDYTPPPAGVLLLNALAAGLATGGATQLRTAHYGPETSASELSVDGWLDLNTTYTYESVRQKSLADERRGDGRPHFLIESAYENERNSTPRSLRAQAYEALLTGAAGQVFGNADIWRFAPSWRDALGSPGSVSMTHLRSLFSSFDWTQLRPDEPPRVLLESAPAGPQAPLLALARDGSLAVAYLPTTTSLRLSARALRRPLTITWFDPANGARRAAPAVGEPTEELTLTAPGRNAGGDEDWVLVLEAAR